MTYRTRIHTCPECGKQLKSMGVARHRAMHADKREKERQVQVQPGPRFVVVPGEVISQSDGDRHFISARQLIELYRVNPAECIVLDRPHEDAQRLMESYIVLKPRHDGDYSQFWL